jgi:hypothetical protein
MKLLLNMAFGGALFAVLAFLGCGQQGSAPEAASASANLTNVAPASDLPSLTLAISGMT